MHEILYPIAKTAEGDWLHIKDAHSGVEVYCPECKSSMVARLGNIKQHHFAHLVSNPICSGESAIHLLGKQLLAYTLEMIGEIRFTTTCPRRQRLFCEQIHCQTIYHKLPIKQIQLEISDDVYKPDLTINLVDDHHIAGEVVYRNPISVEKWNYYLINHIPVLVWKIKSLEDTSIIPLINNSAVHHESINFAYNPKLLVGLAIYTDCDYHKSPPCPEEDNIRLYFYEKKCWKCGQNIRVALFPTELCLDLNFGYSNIGWCSALDEYTASVVGKWNWNFVNEVRRHSGIKLKGYKSKVYGQPEWGLHTVCLNCGRIQGQGWIMNDMEHGECDNVGVIRLQKALCL